MKIYVASSWRNDIQPGVVALLRGAGHEVYDFKNPKWNESGFHWSEIDQGWQYWSFKEYLEALEHPLALSGYKSDIDALDWCDVCVLVLPCGRSAHLELGYAVGQQKLTAILHNGAAEPELMSKMVDRQFDDLLELRKWLEAPYAI